MQLNRRFLRQLRQARFNHDIIQSALDEQTSDLLLYRRLLHEIFEEHPQIRYLYQHILHFPELDTDNEDTEVDDLLMEDEE